MRTEPTSPEVWMNRLSSALDDLRSGEEQTLAPLQIKVSNSCAPCNGAGKADQQACLTGLGHVRRIPDLTLALSQLMHENLLTTSAATAWHNFMLQSRLISSTCPFVEEL